MDIATKIKLRFIIHAGLIPKKELYLYTYNSFVIDDTYQRIRKKK